MNGDRIVSNETSLELIDEATGELYWRLNWTEVDEVVACKEDCGMYDTICIGFRVLGANEYHCCSEEQQGWESLLSTVDRKFPIQPADWLRNIAFPAFEANLTVLWKVASNHT